MSDIKQVSMLFHNENEEEKEEHPNSTKQCNSKMAKLIV